jgi:ABC-type sugar transport system ATPase subunit
LQEVFDLTDRVAVLRDGHLIRVANTKAFTKESIVEAMVGREIDQEFPTRQSKPIKMERLRVESLSSEGKFSDISFSLNQGEVLGIAGLVGSGRTEIAKAIFGVDPNMRGKIFINGKEYHKLTPRKLKDTSQWLT